MSNKTFIFDCDGTLTPSRQKMTPEFEKFFTKWSKTNKFWLVTGSNIEKMDEQISAEVMIESQGLFCCGGNQLWEFDPHIVNFPYNNLYSRDYRPHKPLIEYLQQQIKDSSYKGRYGTHIENRGSMLNFSLVGRDCSLEQRLDYYEWDKVSKERERIAYTINKVWTTLEAVLGGQISIDIAPRGWNKSQVLGHIKESTENVDEFIFIGDKTLEGGNDYPLAKLMKETDGCRVFQTTGPEQTMEILKSEQ
jgi:phosphomannomutase